MSQLTTTLVILGIIALVFLIIALLYMIISFRRRVITMKKVDYLVEDVTYKLEVLTSTVETVAKIANYIDAFEAITKKNAKSAAKLVTRNKDDIYKILERLRNLLVGDEKEHDGDTKKEEYED